jgi:hypothetical protein
MMCHSHLVSDRQKKSLFATFHINLSVSKIAASSAIVLVVEAAVAAAEFSFQ